MRKSAATALLGAYDKILRKRYEPYLAHFRIVVGYDPSIALPRRYHEKMLWRKLFDHSPRIAMFCDKLATRQFVKNTAPALELPELLWTGASPEEIPKEILSERAVFKCNHGCDYNYFWNPGTSDAADLKRSLAVWLASTYGTTNYEWGYTAVQPTILAERFIEGPAATGILDISVRAACGRPMFCSVIAHNKTPRKALGYFDLGGNPIHFDQSAIGQGGYAELPSGQDLRHALRKAAEAAAVLSAGEDYARFDFLYDGQRIYGGEITPYPASGLSEAARAGQVGPDTLINDSWDLRKSWFLSHPQPGFLGLYAFVLRQALS